MPAATLRINIVADASKAADTLNKSAGMADKFAGGINRAALPAAAVVAGLGLMAKAAADDQQAQVILAQSLRNTAGASDAAIASTEDWIAKQAMATGVADDQLRPALATLARSTGDVETAQAGLSTALDISAATGKDVESVSTALAKAYAGNTTALGKMLPGLDKAVLKSGDMTKINEELARMVGGSAAKAADTAAGRYQRMNVAIDEAKESIGSALLPVLGALAGAFATAGEWISHNVGLVGTLVKVIGALAVAVLAAKVGMVAYNIVTGIQAGLTATSTAALQGNTIAMVTYAVRMAAVRVATIAWTAVQWLLNTALLANPITLVVLAIAALVAAVVIAYKKSDTFRAIVTATWNAIKVAAMFVWNNVLKPIFAALVAYYKALWTIALKAAGFVVDAWNWIKQAAITVWNNVLKPVFTFIISYYKMLWNAALAAARFVVNAWNTMKEAALSVWRWIKTNVIDKWILGFKTIFQAVQNARDKIREAWTKVKEIISTVWDGIRAIFDKILGKVQDVVDMFSRIKIPKAVTDFLGKINPFGIAPPVTSAPAVAVPVGRAARETTTHRAPRQADRAPVVVNVILDGKRVGGYVDRLITARLEYEGNRLTAGAWG